MTTRKKIYNKILKRLSQNERFCDSLFHIIFAFSYNKTEYTSVIAADRKVISMQFRSLCNIPVGHSAYVKKLHTAGTMHRRLLDMGLTQNARVTCLYQSPAGDPRAYMIRHTVIALRTEDAQTVEIL